MAPESEAVDRPAAPPISADGLVQQARAAVDGDAAAMDALLRALYPVMARCLRARVRGLDDDAHADALQEAAFRVAHHLRTARALTDAGLRSWACAVAVRAGMALIRARARSEAVGGHSADCPAVDDMAEVTPYRLACRLAVEAQAALPEATAVLLWHRLVDGASWPELACVLGTTPAGAKRRFQRAQAALHRIVRDRAAALPEPDRGAVLAWLIRVQH